MEEEQKSLPIPCPKCGEKTDTTIGGWKKHIQDKHPEIDRLRIGDEVIELKDGKRGKDKDNDAADGVS